MDPAFLSEEQWSIINSEHCKKINPIQRSYQVLFLVSKAFNSLLVNNGEK